MIFLFYCRRILLSFETSEIAMPIGKKATEYFTKRGYNILKSAEKSYTASKNVKLSSEGADSLREKEIFAPFEPRINKGGKER